MTIVLLVLISEISIMPFKCLIARLVMFHITSSVNVVITKLFTNDKSFNDIPLNWNKKIYMFFTSLYDSKGFYASTKKLIKIWHSDNQNISLSCKTNVSSKEYSISMSLSHVVMYKYWWSSWLRQFQTGVTLYKVVKIDQ